MADIKNEIKAAVEAVERELTEKEIGEQRVSLVEARARQEVCKYSTWEYEQLIKDYTEKVKELKAERGLS